MEFQSSPSVARPNAALPHFLVTFSSSNHSLGPPFVRPVSRSRARIVNENHVFFFFFRETRAVSESPRGVIASYRQARDDAGPRLVRWSTTVTLGNRGNRTGERFRTGTATRLRTLRVYAKSGPPQKLKIIFPD
jgi:hypothetical protein